MKSKGFAQIDTHIIVIVLGNLNFNVELSNSQVRDALFKNNIELLKQHDELNQLRRHNVV